jgi:hypothetical protein
MAGLLQGGLCASSPPHCESRSSRPPPRFQPGVSRWMVSFWGALLSAGIVVLRRCRSGAGGPGALAAQLISSERSYRSMTSVDMPDFRASSTRGEISARMASTCDSARSCSAIRAGSTEPPF